MFFLVTDVQLASIEIFVRQDSFIIKITFMLLVCLIVVLDHFSIVFFK